MSSSVRSAMVVFVGVEVEVDVEVEVGGTVDGEGGDVDDDSEVDADIVLATFAVVLGAPVGAGSAATATMRNGGGVVSWLSIDSRAAPDVRVARIDTTAIDRKTGVSPVRRYRPGETEGGSGRHVSDDRLCRPR